LQQKQKLVFLILLRLRMRSTHRPAGGRRLPAALLTYVPITMSASSCSGGRRGVVQLPPEAVAPHHVSVEPCDELTKTASALLDAGRHKDGAFDMVPFHFHRESVFILCLVTRSHSHPHSLL
jgi:hypothetical protein